MHLYLLGSFSIGVMKAGFDLKGVLEITDEMINQNAFYFKKNYPNIPIILPSEWENDEYLDNMKKENYDLMCCNCPCSSLSTINRNASVDGKNNVHFYRLFNVFSHVQPKVFVIENAPTLIKLGFPILKDMVVKLKDIYDFTIIHDKAGNHNVPMQRMRTMVVGWRKDIFKKHPLIKLDIQKKTTSMDVLNDILNDTTNDCRSVGYDDISSLYKYTRSGWPLMLSLVYHYLKKIEGDDETTSKEIFDTIHNSKHVREFNTMLDKVKTGKSVWDKSPFRPKKDGVFPSFSSVQEYMHPVQDRTLNIKELQRLMNYPDDYDFSDPNKECKVPVRQAMAQGVPANFGKWIASMVKNVLDGNCEFSIFNDCPIVFQDNIKQEYSGFTIDEFNNLEYLELNKMKGTLK